MGSVKHQEDIEQELSRWDRILADERFDLLEKIALEMAKANGAKLPPKSTSGALVLSEKSGRFAGARGGIDCATFVPHELTATGMTEQS